VSYSHFDIHKILLFIVYFIVHFYCILLNRSPDKLKKRVFYILVFFCIEKFRDEDW